MKRFHVHLRVENLDRSIAFYTGLFGASPSVAKPDYAKWMLDDPRLNFAISQGNGDTGDIQHLGLQVESADELADVYSRLKAAEGPVLEEGATTCCYARSEKSWIADPDGVVWEAFLTTGEAAEFGASPDFAQIGSTAAGCCTPQAEADRAAGACCAPRTTAASTTSCCG